MTDQPNVLPTFINVGPGRSGSSWFYQALSRHEQVCFSSIKETEYFNTDYHKGPSHYAAFFADCCAPACGEVSNLYYASEICLDRIRTDLPSVKIVFNIRNPFRLLSSMYVFSKRRGINLTPEEFLEAPLGLIMGSGYHVRRLKGELAESDRISVIEAVALRQHIQHLESRFSGGQLYFLILDRVAHCPEEVLREVSRFLGVPPMDSPHIGERIVNEGIEPRIRFVGRLATFTASLLRLVGAYGLLRALHNSSWIKRFFFKQPAHDTAVDFTAIQGAAALASDLQYLEERFGLSLER